MREMVVICDGCGRKSGNTVAAEVTRINVMIENAERQVDRWIVKKTVDLCGGCKSRMANAVGFATETGPVVAAAT